MTHQEQIKHVRSIRRTCSGRIPTEAEACKALLLIAGAEKSARRANRIRGRFSEDCQKELASGMALPNGQLALLEVTPANLTQKQRKAIASNLKKWRKEATHLSDDWKQKAGHLVKEIGGGGEVPGSLVEWYLRTQINQDKVESALSAGEAVIAKARFRGQVGCGYDINDIICAHPFDGETRMYECPKCGNWGEFDSPLFGEPGAQDEAP